MAVRWGEPRRRVRVDRWDTAWALVFAVALLVVAAWSWWPW